MFATGSSSTAGPLADAPGGGQRVADRSWPCSPTSSTRRWSPTWCATYDLVPCSVDSHIGEYLPFAHEIGGHHPAHCDQFARIDRVIERLTAWVADTRLPVPVQRMGHSLEEVVPILAALWTGERRHILAVNVPNRGFIPNVAEGAIVEVGAEVDGDGIHPETMPPIAEPVAGHIAAQIPLQDLIVRSALTGDRDLALQAVLEDPASPPDARERALVRTIDPGLTVEGAEIARIHSARSIARSSGGGRRPVLGHKSVLGVVERFPERREDDDLFVYGLVLPHDLADGGWWVPTFVTGLYENSAFQGDVIGSHDGLPRAPPLPRGHPLQT